MVDPVAAQVGSTVVRLLCFVVAVLVSTWPGSKVITWRQTRLLNKWLKSKTTDEAELKELGIEKAKWSNELALGYTAKIGRIERVLYVMAVMTEQYYALVTAWIILKAISAWNPADPRTSANYHLYLNGNALSLLIGLSCGFLANEVSIIVLRGVFR
jgi:hypothetical protein